MDRVKAMLPVLKKHHFWLLTFIVVLAAVFGWWKGSAGLFEEYETARDNLNGSFTSVEGVSRQIKHPNQSYITGVNDQHNDLKIQVFRAWQLLYADQQKILQWPEQFKEVGELDPDAEIPRPWPSRFHNYYTEEFEALFKKVDPVRFADVPEGADVDPEQIGMVFWDQGQRDAIRDAYVWQTPPSTKAIRFAQEDYWVYTALLTILKRTNDAADATAHYNAALKVINDLRIGKSAERPTTVLKFTTISESTQSSSAAATSSGGGMAGGDSSSGPDDSVLEDGRYVDDKGNRLANAASGPFTEFKLMPVLIELVIDQRRIPLLLAECANSELPVEVRMVRINPGDGGGGAGGGGRRGGGMGGKFSLNDLLPSPAVEPKHQFVAYFYQRGRQQPSRRSSGGGMGANLKEGAPPARTQGPSRGRPSGGGMGANVRGGATPARTQSQPRARSGGGGLGANLGGAAPARSQSPSRGRPSGGGMGGNVGGGQGVGGMGGNIGRGPGGAGAAVKSDHDVTVQLWGLIYIFERPDEAKLKIDEELAKEIAQAGGEDESELSDDAASEEIARGGAGLPERETTSPNPPTN